MLRPLRRLTIILASLCCAVLAGPVAAASAQDDCAVVYCLPPDAPPSADAKRQAADQARRGLGTQVRPAGTVGSALVHAPRGGIAVPRSTRARRVTLKALSIYCPKRCRITTRMSLKAGKRKIKVRRTTRTVPAGRSATVTLSLTRAAVNRIRSAGRATLTARVTVTDGDGSYRKRVRVPVRVAPPTR